LEAFGMKVTISKRVGAFEAKTHLSQLLAEVEAGACVEITSRGKPMAILISPATAYPNTEDLPALVAQVRERRKAYGVSPEEIHAWKAEGRP